MAKRTLGPRLPSQMGSLARWTPDEVITRAEDAGRQSSAHSRKPSAPRLARPSRPAPLSAVLTDVRQCAW